MYHTKQQHANCAKASLVRSIRVVQYQEHKDKYPGLRMEDSAISLDRLRSLCQKISELPTNEHSDILRIIKLSGVDITENDNGTFVDLCAMPLSMIAELEQMVKVSQFQQTRQATADELTSVASSTSEMPKRWDANIDSKVVFDRAQDLVKKHLYKCIDTIGQKDVRKRNAAKKNFICTTKKTDVYEPQCNELDEVERYEAGGHKDIAATPSTRHVR